MFFLVVRSEIFDFLEWIERVQGLRVCCLSSGWYRKGAVKNQKRKNKMHMDTVSRESVEPCVLDFGSHS